MMQLIIFQEFHQTAKYISKLELKDLQKIKNVYLFLRRVTNAQFAAVMK